MPIETLSPLLDVPGISWVNLQVGPLNAEGDAAGIVWNPARSLRDYRETAELISRLDLVITVDTSVAHLTGALGIPVWVMLPVPPDWRWGVATNTSPWYSSSRLFRQRRMGDWGSVVTEITAQLQSIRR